MKAAGHIAVLSIFLFVSVIVSLFLGGARIPPADLIHALFEPGGYGSTWTILWEIRIPRVILGLLVGAGLGVSGAALQALLRNPLAEPYTLGVSGGAALGATLGSLFMTGGALGGFSLPLWAFIGALGSTVCVYMIAGRRRFSITTLILGGIVLNLLLSSLILLIFSLSKREQVISLLLWLLGDLSIFQKNVILSIATFVIIGMGALMAFSSDLNLLTLGEEKATYLGVEVETVQKLLFILSSLITGACVAASGIIGFVGLIIPHVVRYFTGPDHRAVLPGCFLAGAGFLILCDALARSIISPIELPVGVLTGIVGGGFFLVYLMGGKEWQSF